MSTNIEQFHKLEMLQSFFKEEDYNRFLRAVSSNQDKILKVDTRPIDNYRTTVIKEEDISLLKYIYQNVKYYLGNGSNYLPKIEEGLAIFISKVAIIQNYSKALVNSYFSRGDYSKDHEIKNPFEEMSRLLLLSLRPFDVNEQYNEKNSIDKIRFENDASINIISLALSQDGLMNIPSNYCYNDIISSIAEELEFSNINSINKMSATKEDNSKIILQQFDKITELYHYNLDFHTIVTGFPTEKYSDMLRTRFNDKIFYAKRNIGIYEHTKKLIK